MIVNLITLKDSLLFCMMLTALREKEVVLLYFEFLSTSEYEFHNVLILKYFLSISDLYQRLFFTLFPFLCSFKLEKVCIFVFDGVYFYFISFIDI